MTVHRTRPLAEATNRGRLIVPEFVALTTRIALQGFRGPDGRHEGLLFWSGRRIGNDTLVAGAIVPVCDHGSQFVQAAPNAVGSAARAARSLGLGLVAQVHSHPGNDTRHSSGDDSMILMPFEGMFSIVVACYGDGGITQDAGVGVHQYQERQWVRIPAGCRGALVVVPALIGNSE